MCQDLNNGVGLVVTLRLAVFGADVVVSSDGLEASSDNIGEVHANVGEVEGKSGGIKVRLKGRDIEDGLSCVDVDWDSDIGADLGC